jgi:predicted transglutaminase-like cysteine proteinase
MGPRQYIYVFVFSLFGGLQSECGYAAQTKVAPGPLAFAPVESWLDRPVPAWLDYCVRHSDDCQTDLRQPVKVALTPQLLKKLKAVNRVVNARVRPMTDLQHWGVKDHWDQAEDGYGDCEDYQLLKRKQLIDAGVPRRTMLMTVAWDAYHEGHALLMIRTNIGDLILDNARDEILLWKETGYQFVKRESQYSTGWVDIAAPVGTASIN